MIPGVSFETITKTIASSYDYRELETLVRNRFDTRLDLITAPGRFENVVFDLLSWAERNGRENELIMAVVRDKPNRSDVQKLSKLYGLSAPVSVRRSGHRLNAASYVFPDSGLEEIVRPFTGIAEFADWTQRLVELEGQICRITCRGASKGTGFLVGPDAVLTAGHVLRDVVDGITPPELVRFQFGYKVLKDNSQTDTGVFGLAEDWLLDYSRPTSGEDDGQPDRALPSNNELDFALVRLAVPIGEKPIDPNSGPSASLRKWVRIPAVPPVFRSPMPLVILQYPAGHALQVALDTQGIDQPSGFWLNANQTRIRYATNTEPGSSGSPCFDFDWNLLALHQYGDGGYGGGGEFNQGTPIVAIRASIARKPNALAALGD